MSDPDEGGSRKVPTVCIVEGSERILAPKVKWVSPCANAVVMKLPSTGSDCRPTWLSVARFDWFQISKALG